MKPPPMPSRSHPPQLRGRGERGLDQKIENLEEKSEIMMYNEQKINLEIKMLEEWTNICKARSFALKLIESE